ncbi:MAG: SET domain-containing protein-lysine N-methyltransferase [bacterium]|nr:SET domain-containing protein-lysine N-methyltransferase [bacterium]
MQKNDETGCIAFNVRNVEAGSSPKHYGRTYFAKKDFQPGEEIMRGYGRIVDHQTAHRSVQIGPRKHYMPTKWTGAYWNHSCDPNAYMRTRTDGFPSLYALKHIKRGDEIMYSYAMSEYAWSKGADENEVICRCGVKNCKKKIRAFSQLSPKEQEQLRRKRLCATYLLGMV